MLRFALAIIALAIIALGAFAANAEPVGNGVLLEATFDDKTIDAPIGTGGAGAGEPIAVGSGVTAIVRDAPFATPSLEIADVQSNFADAVRFEWGSEATTGAVSISAKLWFEEIDYFFVRVRERGSAASNFLNVEFRSAGEIFVSDAGGSVGNVGSYEAGRAVTIVIDFDLDAGTYTLGVDGAFLVVGEPHGVSGRGVGGLYVGTGFDPDLVGTLHLDDVLVVGPLPSPVEATTFTAIKSAYRN